MRQKSRAGGLLAAAPPEEEPVKAENPTLPIGPSPPPAVSVHASASEQQPAAQPVGATVSANAAVSSAAPAQVRPRCLCVPPHLPHHELDQAAPLHPT